MLTYDSMYYLTLCFGDLLDGNFFLYSSGNWMKNNPIPSGYPSWNSFMSLSLRSQEDCKTILSELEEKLKSEGGATEEERKVALFCQATIDEDAIEKVRESI